MTLKSSQKSQPAQDSHPPLPTAGSAPPANPPRPRFDRRVLLGCVLLSVATLLAFGHVTANDFVNYDDPDHVADNPFVRAGLTNAAVRWALTTTNPVNPCWQPLTWLSLMLDSQLQGTEARGYH